jgi:methyltransferase
MNAGSVLYWALFLAFLGRLLEFARSQRNTRALLAAGGVESGQAQYPLFVLLHFSWFLAMLLALPADAPANWWLLGVYVLLQGLRVWSIASLGPFYTTRIIVVPGAELVRRGPYRFFRHPIYAVVTAELIVMPLAFGAVAIAVFFTLLNLALLSARIRAENEALRHMKEPEAKACRR